MAPRLPNYHSYLLRLWQVGVGWRASLEDVETGELQGFSDLAALSDYLEKQAFAKKVEETDLPTE
jgi:hypothetical protein